MQKLEIIVMLTYNKEIHNNSLENEYECFNCNQCNPWIWGKTNIR